jgi:hypothetical protein
MDKEKHELFGLCLLSVVPVRQYPEDQSELVTQLLFGETFTIEKDKNAKWLKIKCTLDNYEGWIDAKQAQLISQQEYNKIQQANTYSLELMQPAMADNFSLPLLLGSSLPNFNGFYFRLAGTRYDFSGQVIDPSQLTITREIILKIARKYLHAPYLWGGRSPFGIDCSGFVQVVFKMAGYNLWRDASQQAQQGETVAFIQEALPADLAFFENKKGKVTHVGIILPDNQIIHASGQVRIDKIDQFGIFNENTQQYSHSLRCLKRILI